jgi:hypothetical protein
MPPKVLNIYNLIGETQCSKSKEPGAMLWKDRGEVCILSNMHISLVEGDFREGGKAVKPLVIEDYEAHMGYVDLCDKMVNGYNITESGNG